MHMEKNLIKKMIKLIKWILNKKIDNGFKADAIADTSDDTMSAFDPFPK